jgi:hypothetical protein
VSFRFADLKKSVRKGKDGYQISPVRLESRSAAFQVEFLLQQFEAHLGRPRRCLDPRTLLDFVGDARLGRGLLATLAQWYRLRPLTFAEVLGEEGPGERVGRLLEAGIAGPVDLRGYLYQGVNDVASGFLDPAGEAVFWRSHARALGLRAAELQKLTLLDRPEEAVLVRLAPRPAAADVIAAYHARSLTTLLRSAAEVTAVCASADEARRAAARWAGPFGVEWEPVGGALTLRGRADALGSWTRHGRHVERALLELVADPRVGVKEVHGAITASGKECRFRWKAETLDSLGAASGAAASAEETDALAVCLRKERESLTGAAWSIRRAAHIIAGREGALLPHFELRQTDSVLYLRLTCGEGAAAPAGLPLVCISPGDPGRETFHLRFPGGGCGIHGADHLLSALQLWLAGRQKAAPAVPVESLRRAA